MLKAGTETGSLINHVLSGAFDLSKVKVGDPATMLHWTDRTPGTVVKITRCTIQVQVDTFHALGPIYQTEQQEYSYTPNPQGHVYTFRLRKNKGWRNVCGDGLCIGRREAYRDPSF